MRAAARTSSSTSLRSANRLPGLAEDQRVEFEVTRRRQGAVRRQRRRHLAARRVTVPAPCRVLSRRAGRGVQKPHPVLANGRATPAANRSHRRSRFSLKCACKVFDFALAIRVHSFRPADFGPPCRALPVPPGALKPIQPGGFPRGRSASAHQTRRVRRMATGTVKWFNATKGFGFIARRTAARTCSSTSPPCRRPACRA